MRQNDNGNYTNSVRSHPELLGRLIGIILMLTRGEGSNVSTSRTRGTYFDPVCPSSGVTIDESAVSGLVGDSITVQAWVHIKHGGTVVLFQTVLSHSEKE